MSDYIIFTENDEYIILFCIALVLELYRGLKDKGVSLISAIFRVAQEREQQHLRSYIDRYLSTKNL